jgi:hypothetical protein
MYFAVALGVTKLIINVMKLLTLCCDTKPYIAVNKLVSEAGLLKSDFSIATKCDLTHDNHCYKIGYT